VDEPDPRQIARYREMTPAQKLRQAEALYWMARDLRAAYERQLHPDWSEERVQSHVRTVFLRAVT
jgi:hypothetical protein